MTTIHMKTESVEAAISQLQRSAYDLDGHVHDLGRQISSLRSAWHGGSTPAKFHQEIENVYRKLIAASQSIEALETRLEFEYQEWVQADAVFGVGSAGHSSGRNGSAGVQAPTLTLAELRESICGSKSGGDKTRCENIWSHPPENYEQLAYMIMNLPEDRPIVIMQIGDGEYLVLLRGTVGLEDAGHNWGSAVEAMFGNSSYQNSVIDAIKNANLPDGAQLHFAGHSQGGMVAQNLAVDPRVTNYFDVESVTMFGSPDTMSTANPGTHYVSFEAVGDVVPKLDDIVEAGLGPQPSLHDVSSIAEKHTISTTWDALNFFNQNDSHGVYDNPGVLSNYKTPFGDASWNPVDISGTDVTTLGPKIYKGIKNLKEAADVVINDLSKM